MRWAITTICLLVGSSTFAATWTNTAGHAMEAELVARKGEKFVMQLENGAKIKIHRNGLSTACQKRAEALFPIKKTTHAENVKKRQALRLRLLREKLARSVDDPS